MNAHPHFVGPSPVILQAPVTYTQHAPGMPHIRSTIEKMAALAREGSHSYGIRNLATRIVHDVPSKQRTRELGALYRWVRDNIRYRFDPVGLEWVQRPERTVLERAGDCDDIATLLAALAGALGHPWRFDTVGPSAGVQKHIAAQAHDGATWVTLDPVLEPPATSNAPRADDGRFGQLAPGVHHIWNQEGRMLSGPTTERERELWEWVAYYPQVPPTGGYHPRPPGGSFPRIDPRYRSGNAPGYQKGRALLALPKSVTSQLTRDEQGNLQYAHLGAFGFLKKIGKAVGKVVKGAGKLARSTVVSSVANVIAPGSGAMIHKIGTTEKQAERSVSAIKHGGVKALASMALKAGINRIAPGSGQAGALLRAGLHAGTKVALKSKRRPVSAQHAPAPALKRKYPSNARQTWDARAGVYRVFVPHGRMSGLGAFRPTISFALGAASSAQAKAAVTAVQTFMKSSKQAPQVALPAMRAFQQADGLLSADGLWGPNARVAAAYYLGVAVTSLPPVAAPYAKYKVTWIPPGARAQAKAAGVPMPSAAVPAAAATAPVPTAATTPAGFTQVGTEKQNPGLPPVGIDQAAAARSAPPAPGGVVPAAAYAPTADVVGPSSSAQATRVVAVGPATASALTPPVSMPSPIVVGPTATPTAVSVTTGADGRPIVTKAGPTAPGGLPAPEGGIFRTSQVFPAGKSDNTLVWAALAYLYWRNRKRVA